MNLEAVKARFGIIGNSPQLNNALERALRVAPTDLTVLINGESGTGKEIFAQVIHYNSHRKHNPYIAVNCGAIPEGTIDSELFGHVKGSFTGAYEDRKGYFEVANKGTIFLDEVGELPQGTQAKLLRVLETGEFIRVGSSKVLKTDVRIIAATNKNLKEEVNKGNFREDLFYRLSTVPIYIPPLRERGQDIFLLFTKFALDFAEKYNMTPIKLDEEAKKILLTYHWPGNVRQLKNITEQISIIETDRIINAETLLKYLPDYHEHKLPVLAPTKENISDRDLMYKFLIDIKKDIAEIKEAIKLLGTVLTKTQIHQPPLNTNQLPIKYDEQIFMQDTSMPPQPDKIEKNEIVKENLSLADMEKELIIKALEKHRGKRRPAAEELGISERTLYRKIKEYGINL